MIKDASHRRRPQIHRAWRAEDTTRSCLHVILEEEREHHRYAVRDLDTIEAKRDA